MQIPQCPIKQYLAARGIHSPSVFAPMRSEASSSTRIFALILGTSFENPIWKLIPYAEQWPDRDKVPTIRDIVARRQSVPVDVSPCHVGELAAHYYGWISRPL